MKGTMKVAVMNGIGQMGFIERPIPQPADNEVLVKLEYVASVAQTCTTMKRDASVTTL
ncbi:hypothetical protein JCM6292_442 [Bacteroides pyogenes JCM 6292]|uniref:Alcohol dehydrogenase n=2 Tax=Bacteroides pyogenes TaxID=310300 RepID=W4PEF0_9BACE|nr:hypothetical protein JCM6292_442 [Bacteroides pyogenes JCM 6292]GAE18085.1 hypothetical protein JCM6294_936 [Bacteroides pyogenes DSM 20611 = JCM 6294]